MPIFFRKKIYVQNDLRLTLLITGVPKRFVPFRVQLKWDGHTTKKGIDTLLGTPVKRGMLTLFHLCLIGFI